VFESEKLCDLLAKSGEYGRLVANNMQMEFLLYIMKKDRNLLLKLREVLLSNQEEPWVALHVGLLSNPSIPKSYLCKFYEVLEKYRYLEEAEILECISTISSGKIKDFSFWLSCPWIKSISYEEKSRMYTIKSTNGDFSFVPISYMYENELNVIKQIGKKKGTTGAKKLENGYDSESYENFDYQCHFVSYEFSKLHLEDYAVTCICPQAFPNNYWLHSYNISYNGVYVIDIANGFVMPIEDYNRLIQPCNLDITKGEDVLSHLQQIKDDKSWPFFNVIKSPLKTLAFYHYDMLTEEQREEKYGDLLRNLKKLK